MNEQVDATSQEPEDPASRAVAQLHTEIRELRAALIGLQAQVQRQGARRKPPLAPDNPPGPSQTTAPGRAVRRAVLRGSGLAAAGLAVAALAGKQAEPAEADYEGSNTGSTPSNAHYGVAAVPGAGTAAPAVSGTYGVIGFSDTGATDPGTVAGVAGTSSSGHGVAGSTPSSNAAYAGVSGTNTGAGPGVLGQNSSQTGVHGISTSGQGVRGDSTSGFGLVGQTSTGTGLLGYSQTGHGLQGFSYGASGYYGLIGNGYSGADGVLGYSTAGLGIVGMASPNYAGAFYGGGPSGQGCYIDGSLTVTGTKSRVVPTHSQGLRKLYAIESPENWFEDVGTVQLAGGRAQVTIDPTFAETVDLTGDYYVFVTPRSGASLGLAVIDATPTSFTIVELNGGTGSYPVDYRIMAHQRGLANVRLEQATVPPPPPAAAVRLPPNFKP